MNEMKKKFDLVWHNRNLIELIKQWAPYKKYEKIKNLHEDLIKKTEQLNPEERERRQKVYNEQYLRAIQIFTRMLMDQNRKYFPKVEDEYEDE
jgi:glutamine synthetase type III